MGTIATGKGDYSQGLTYGLLALKTAEEQKDSSLQLCTILNRLSVTLYELGDYEHALDFSQRSLKIASHYKDTTAILTVSTNFITIYLRDNQPAKALELLNRIVALYKTPIQKDHIWISTNLIRCYVQLQQMDKAAAFVPGLLAISAKMSKYNYYQTMIYSALVMYYIHGKQFEKAAEFCALQSDVCKQIGQLNGLSHNYLQWFRADSALGNYPAAIRHYKDYKVLNDSLFRISKAGEIARLQVQYDFDQKNKDITLKQQNIELLTRQGLLQRAALKEARLTRNIIIFGAVMLLLLLILSYNRYQLKQASNRQLQQNRKKFICRISLYKD
ncbi:tetratricopeptide repeat protein [Chitinophaga pinensis]|uniref:Tetratricopeptide repeat protein n=1 Tax=Chitinophaga pinensis TaxID=79329 RepID=A0A5C6LL75_9BACT|nr:tetratricopeptide repeat protein [Chitinophaga pinensis]TWV96197.1 tetratricopeptide repeat protein [Chitinophaga pinensis]